MTGCIYCHLPVLCRQGDWHYTCGPTCTRCHTPISSKDRTEFIRIPNPDDASDIITVEVHIHCAPTKTKDAS